MPSDRPVVAFRPDQFEEEKLENIRRVTGLPKAQILGMAFRAYIEHWEEQRAAEKHQVRLKNRDRILPSLNSIDSVEQGEGDV